MKTVIKIEQLSKVYQLGQIGTGTISNDLKRWTSKIRGKEDPFLRIGEINDRAQKGGDFVYSLKDINLEIKRGEALGIIGKNGAGKSTLLKIISRITAPTAGEIKIKGRVASLLEVGTGFHPELTGKENIYLNGAILGMRKAEITQKLDEIIAFSGVERYIDTPVKRYSSGMYVRLAFAVAAHLDSEILIVDEVLAVGDAEFQKKCLGKMSEMQHQNGRTVIFVSHDMGAISQLCSSIVVMEQGGISLETKNIKEGINSYLNINTDVLQSFWKVENHLSQKRSPYFSPLLFFASLKNSEKVLESFVTNNQEIQINLAFEVEEIDSSLEIGIEVFDENNQQVFVSTSCDLEQENWPKIALGKNKIAVVIPAHFLNEGVYRVNLICCLFQKEWIIDPKNTAISINFRIQGGLSLSPTWTGKRNGITAPILAWKNGN